MVSKASEDLPDPDKPVTTVSVLRGIWTLISRRLCCLAPRTVIWVMAMRKRGYCWVTPSQKSCRYRAESGLQNGETSAQIGGSSFRYLIRQQKTRSTIHCTPTFLEPKPSQELVRGSEVSPNAERNELADAGLRDCRVTGFWRAARLWSMPGGVCGFPSACRIGCGATRRGPGCLRLAVLGWLPHRRIHPPVSVLF